MAIIGVDLDGDQLVLTRRRDFKWTFENLDASRPPQPVDFPAGELFFELETGNAHNAVQRVGVLKSNSGFYHLGFNGNHAPSPLDIDYTDVAENPQDNPGDITDYIEAIPTDSIDHFKQLPDVGAGNVEVSPLELYPVWRCDVQLTGSAQNEIQEVDATNIVAEIASWFSIPKSDVIGKGQFKLRHNHGVTNALKFDATDAEVELEIQQLPGIGPGNVTVTKPADYRWKVEFKNVLGNRNVDQIEVDVYQTQLDPSNIFDWFLGDLWTKVTSKTVQQGQESAFNERLTNLVNKYVNDFFNLFDSLLGVNVEFTVDNPTDTTPNITPSMSLVVTGLNPWGADTIGMFLLDNAIDSLQDFLNGVLSWAHVWTVVSLGFHWNKYFNVEFTGELAETPVPLLTSDASGLSNDINEPEAQPEVTVEMLNPGKGRVSRWYFVVDGPEASLKVESAECDKIIERTEWQLVFLPDGEPAGGDPIALGRVRVQGD